MERSNIHIYIYTLVQNLFHRTWKWTSRRYQYGLLFRGSEDPKLSGSFWSLLGNTSWAWTGQSELIKLVYFWSGSMVCVFLISNSKIMFLLHMLSKKWICLIIYLLGGSLGFTRMYYSDTTLWTNSTITLTDFLTNSPQTKFLSQCLLTYRFGNGCESILGAPVPLSLGFKYLVDNSWIHDEDIPGTQMTPVLTGKDLVLEGLKPQNKGQTGSKYRYNNI